MTSRFCEHVGPGPRKQSGSCLDIWKGLRISGLSSSKSETFLADFLPDTQYVFINPFPCTQEDKHNMKPDKYLTLASFPFQFGMCNSLTGLIQLCCFRTRVEYKVSGKGLSVKHFRNGCMGSYTACGTQSTFPTDQLLGQCSEMHTLTSTFPLPSTMKSVPCKSSAVTSLMWIFMGCTQTHSGI